MKNKFALALLIASSTSMSVSAAERGFFIGGTIGTSDFDFTNDIHEFTLRDVDNSSFDEDSFSIRGGYKIFRYLAVEVSINRFGEVEETTSFTSTNLSSREVTSLDNRSIAHAVVGIYPVSDNIDLFGKVGIERWESDGSRDEHFIQAAPPIDSQYKRSVKFEGNDVYLGLGASYRFITSLEVSLEYEYHSWDKKYFELENNNFSLGLNYYF